MMTQLKLPFHKLRLSKLNVRKTYTQSGIERLAANIRALGVLQPLRLKPAAKAGRYEVTDGGRRYRAIAHNILTGHFDKNYLLPVIIAEGSDDVIREQSLAANILSEAMTPAEECAAFLDIINDGADVDAVADRFGTTVRYVQGRLRLASLAPPIFKALAAGKISLEIAMAYGATPDQAKQMQVWKSLSGGFQASNCMTIKRAVTDNVIEASNPIALFVGLEAYLEAAGRTERELFLTDDQTNWIDADLAHRLAEEKLAAQAEAIVASGKLAWVTPLLTRTPGYDATKNLHPYFRECKKMSDENDARTKALEARKDELTKQISAINKDGPDKDALMEERDRVTEEHLNLLEATFFIEPDMKPYVGRFLVLKGDGTAELHHQFYATKVLRKPKSAKSGDEVTVANDAPELTRRISDALAMTRRDVLALHVANDPALALDLALFQLALPLVNPHWRHQTGSTIAINDISDPLSRSQTPASHARIEIEKMAQALDTSWADQPSASTAFMAFRAIDESVKATWLGLSVACSLKASLSTQGNFANPFHDALGCALGIDVADFWRPTAENYFDGLKKHAILGAIADFGDASIAARYAASKKSDLAKAAEKLCAGAAIVEPAVKERALAWVPPEMRFAQLPEADEAVSLHDAEPYDASMDAAERDDSIVTPGSTKDCEAELMAA